MKEFKGLPQTVLNPKDDFGQRWANALFNENTSAFDAFLKLINSSKDSERKRTFVRQFNKFYEEGSSKWERKYKLMGQVIIDSYKRQN